MAAQMPGYTLSDRATYGAYRAKTGLTIAIEGDPQMFNPYGVIAVNPARHPGANYTDTMKFVEWNTASSGSASDTLLASCYVDAQAAVLPELQGEVVRPALRLRWPSSRRQ